MPINTLINELKENHQDFEFYPTTKEMIKTIYRYAPQWGVWLDIGCGTCNFKKYFEEIRNEQQQRYDAKENAFRNSYTEGKGYNYDLQPKECDKPKSIHKYYVIEKSKILLERLEKDTICLGTDFASTLLLDKPVDNIFCNPPYSEYEQWASRIIQEANCRRIFLIIPTRWKDSEKIKQALECSNSTYMVLDTMDFNNAERRARAIVDIVYISRKDDRYRDLEDYNVTAFDKWFDDIFKMRDKKNSGEWEKEKIETEKIKNQLVNAEGSKAKILVDLYNNEVETLFNHFKAIASLDVDVLETIGIKKAAVKEALKKKALGAKIKYWKLAFDELEEITDRLTSKTRQDMFRRFKELQTVDFTLENIYPLILWVFKNASSYYNEQLITFFKELSKEENVKPYKSNQRLFEKDGYYWNCEKKTHYLLDYRIIMSSPFRVHWYNGTLENDNAEITLKDIFVIAKNLGFNVGHYEMPKSFGEECTVLYEKSDKVFMKYRTYKNGNMHVKFDIEFTKAMNVEVSRLLGWIRSKEDIKKEFPENFAAGAEKYFKQNYSCLGNTTKLLLTTRPALEHIANKTEQTILIKQTADSCLDLIINNIAKINNIAEEQETINKCKSILTTQKGFIYRNCLVTKEDEYTKIEFRENADFTVFQNLLTA